MQENWFVFVDTFDQSSRADAVIAELSSQGLDAKVAVESRSGELFYRVQVVGIGSRADGESIVTQLKDGEFKNARLKRSVN
jgi:cell division protein FtsN